MTSTATQTQPFEAEFERHVSECADVSGSLQPDLREWFVETRAAGMASFRSLGLPGPRDEDWLYTNTTPLRRTPFPAAPATAIVPESLAAHRFALGLDETPRLVFLNGRYEPSLSITAGLPKGVVFSNLATAFEDASVRERLGRIASQDVHPFAALNTAFLQDGAYVHIPAGVDVEQPLQLLFLHTPTGEAVAVHPRVLVRAEAGSRATIVERYGIDCIGALAGGTCLTNAISEYDLAASASVRVVRVQREGTRTYHVGLTAVRQGQDSRFDSTAVSLGGALDRNEAQLELAEPGATCSLNGLYVISNKEHVDNHTIVRHAVPHCQSAQLFKGILAGQSRGAFTGRVIVAPHAQKTEATQANHNLLLSREATAQTRPQLEIYADDVKCDHGATIGRLDEDALYYLRTRGIGPIRSRNLLVHAFASEITEAVGQADLTAGLEALLAARLEAGPAIQTDASED